MERGIKRFCVTGDLVGAIEAIDNPAGVFPVGRLGVDIASQPDAAEPATDHAFEKDTRRDLRFQGAFRFVEQINADQIADPAVITGPGQLHIAAPAVFHPVAGMDIAVRPGQSRTL